MEDFYEIPQFPQYEANKSGVVRNKKNHEIMTICHTNIYPHVNLSKNKKTVHVRLHILLAKMFIVNPDPNNNKIVNHKDGDKNNFELSNLEWTTRSKNTQHAWDTGLMSRETQGYPVLAKDSAGHVVAEYKSVSHAAKEAEGFITKQSLTRRIVAKKRVYGMLYEYKYQEAKSGNNPQMFGETWKPVLYPNVTEGRYEVSDFGRMRNAKKDILRQHVDQEYNFVNLRQLDGKYRHFKVHILVAFAHVPGYNETLIVHHKNSNTFDNTVANLEWCTQKQNVIYAVGVKVAKASPNGQIIETFSSIKQAADSIGYTSTHLMSFLNTGKLFCDFIWNKC